MDSFYLDIQELRNPNTTHRLNVHWWNTIKDIKKQLYNITLEPPSHQHIFYSTNPTELKNSWTLHDMGIEEAGTVLRIAIDYNTRSAFTLSAANNVELDEDCKQMISEVKLGFQKGKVPTPTDEFDGSGGVYFLRSARGQYTAVFKPHDEEQGMPNNPKDHAGTGAHGLREYFHPGQGCLRELAAYIMDYQGFCRVPPTTLVHCEHSMFHHPTGVKGVSGSPFPKLGSLQKFVKGADDSFDDIGVNLISDFEIQKIALLDIRILNCDRNGANILIQQNHDDDDNHYELIPIDHGYCMPSKLLISEWDWVWYTCTHISRPLHPDIKKYLLSININDLLSKIKRQASISEDCLFLLEIIHFLLIQGVEYDLTLKDIASMIVRPADMESVPSRLESLLNEAEENAFRAIEVKNTRMSKLSSNNKFDEKKDPLQTSSSTDSFHTDSPRPDSSCDSNYSSPKRPHANYSLMESKNCQSSNNLLKLSSKVLNKQSGNAINYDHNNTLVNDLPAIMERARQRGISDLSNNSESSSLENGDFMIVSSPKDNSLILSKLMQESEDMVKPVMDEGSIVDFESTSTKNNNVDLTGPPIDLGTPQPLKYMASVDGSYSAIDSISKTRKSTPIAMTSISSNLEGKPLINVKSYAYSDLNVTLINNSNNTKRESSDSTAQSLDSLLHVATDTSMSPPPSLDQDYFHDEGSPLKYYNPNDLVSPHSSATTNATSLSSRTPIPVSGSNEDVDKEGYLTQHVDVEDYDHPASQCIDDLSAGPSSSTPAEGGSDPKLFGSSAKFSSHELLVAPSLVRVATFSGFDSSPQYSNISARAMGNLKLERRRVIAISDEFLQIRRNFAIDAVKSALSRIANKKKRPSHLL